jgi:predicted  nucleic acid-binding Zn-ribbon protein
MLKKVVIAALAVAVGVAVLAFVSPKLFSLMGYYCEQGQKSVEDAIPPETELDRIKHEVDGAKADEIKLFHNIAVAELSVKKLDGQIADNQKDLKPLEARVDDLAASLEKDKNATKVSYNGRNVKREDVVSTLNAAVEERDAKRAELQANQDQRDQSQSLLDQLNKQKDDFKATIAKLGARMKEVEVKIQKVRTAQSNVPALQANDDRLSRAKDDLEKLSDRLDVDARTAELAGANAPKPTTAAVPSEDDLLKRAHSNGGDQPVDPGKTTKAD